STYARVGLSMHQTAPWIQPGWKGPIVLEMMNDGPLDIELTPLIDRPCQLTFLKLNKALPKKLAYGSKAVDSYQGQSHPLKPQHKKGQKNYRLALSVRRISTLGQLGAKTIDTLNERLWYADEERFGEKEGATPLELLRGRGFSLLDPMFEMNRQRKGQPV